MWRAAKSLLFPEPKRSLEPLANAVPGDRFADVDISVISDHSSLCSLTALLISACSLQMMQMAMVMRNQINPLHEGFITDGKQIKSLTQELKQAKTAEVKAAEEGGSPEGVGMAEAGMVALTNANKKLGSEEDVAKVEVARSKEALVEAKAMSKDLEGCVTGLEEDVPGNKCLVEMRTQTMVDLEPEEDDLTNAEASITDSTARDATACRP
ncbi:hypothetical protein L6452_36852 [Arctium lappa]|uniref:Uncharacterized protein n=1 Tax=Arctium lappa TaxID=4217 RepID=A0ACB8Y1B6_ARCLA|nr:hypothetical protein L6452_36852 [Arctium lappa]